MPPTQNKDHQPTSSPSEPQQPVLAAPLLDISQNQSALQQALSRCQTELQKIATQADMVMAVADAGSTIIWTKASRSMASAAEQVHFVAGGQWAENQVGLNALAQAIKIKQPSSIASDEHPMESIHDWICYAAPIVDPHTQQIVGVVDLSTKLKQQNKLGIIAAEHCAQIIQNSLSEQHKNTLSIRAIDASDVFFANKRLSLSPRQLEILIILVLHPKGLTLDELHQALYGDKAISSSTLKSEISQLRQRLNGLIDSRPYKLLVPVQADFLELETVISAGYIDAALQRAQGVFLRLTTSPFLITWRTYLESRLSFLIQKSTQVDALLKHLSYSDDPDAYTRVNELLSHHPLRHKLPIDS